MLKRKRGRPRLTPEQKLERQKAKILREKERTERKNKALASRKIISYVLTPAGKSPFVLYGSDKEAVILWLKQFKTHATTYKNYTSQSLAYWIRDFYSVLSDEYKEAEKHLIANGPEYGFPDMSAKLALLYKRVEKESKQGEEQ